LTNLNKLKIMKAIKKKIEHSEIITLEDSEEIDDKEETEEKTETEENEDENEECNYLLEKCFVFYYYKFRQTDKQFKKEKLNKKNKNNVCIISETKKFIKKINHTNNLKEHKNNGNNAKKSDLNNKNKRNVKMKNEEKEIIKISDEEEEDGNIISLVENNIEKNNNEKKIMAIQNIKYPEKINEKNLPKHTFHYYLDNGREKGVDKDDDKKNYLLCKKKKRTNRTNNFYNKKYSLRKRK